MDVLALDVAPSRARSFVSGITDLSGMWRRSLRAIAFCVIAALIAGTASSPLVHSGQDPVVQQHPRTAVAVHSIVEGVPIARGSLRAPTTTGKVRGTLTTTGQVRDDPVDRTTRVARATPVVFAVPGRPQGHVLPSHGHTTLRAVEVGVPVVESSTFRGQTGPTLALTSLTSTTTTNCPGLAQSTLSNAGITPSVLAKRIGTTSTAINTEVANLCAGGISPPQVAAQLMKEASYTVSQIAGLLKTGFALTALAAATVLQALGFAVNAIATALVQAYNLAAQDAAALLKTLGYTASQVLDALKTVYSLAAQAGAQILKDIGFAVNAVAGALQSVFGKLAGDAAQILKDVGF